MLRIRQKKLEILFYQAEFFVRKKKKKKVSTEHCRLKKTMT
jgi:hypothetical protein